jgi:hypothetical protein
MLAGFGVGIVMHELTHYAVLRAGGVDARFAVPSLNGSRATFGVEFEIDESRIAWLQASGVAPILTAGVIAAVAVAMEVWTFGIVGIAFAAGAVLRTGRLSRQDIRVARAEF